MSKKDIRPYLHTLLGLCNKNDLLSDFLRLEVRILKIGNNNKSTYLHSYLKRCVFLIIRYLAGRPILETGNTGLLVKVDETGLPSILPRNLRRLISLKKPKELIVILSYLGMYRSLKTLVLTDFSSIVDPFSGTVKTFPEESLEKARKSLSTLANDDLKIWVKKPRILGGESTGPNTKRALWGADADILGFLYRPYFGMQMVLMLFASRSGLYLFGFVLLSILMIPYGIFTLLFDNRASNKEYAYRLGRLFDPDTHPALEEEKSKGLGFLKRIEFTIKDVALGRLAVVYNTAGKARIVAITNWGTQLVLKPLHDSIFGILRKLPTDGTFNQTAPLERLIAIHQGQKIYSFDLTAATDRIPIEVQRDILKVFGYKCYNLGQKLLSVPWCGDHTRTVSKQEVYYSVGQPMGAYSSWASLALTHHCIIHLAAVNKGLETFSDYCILGDDVVIMNELVAEEYLRLMELLGVNINLAKSVQSDRFCEFAKKGVGTLENGDKIDFSPIGSGLILNTIREKNYIIRVLWEMTKRIFVRMSDPVYNFSGDSSGRFKFDYPVFMDSLVERASKKTNNVLTICDLADIIDRGSDKPKCVRARLDFIRPVDLISSVLDQKVHEEQLPAYHDMTLSQLLKSIKGEVGFRNLYNTFKRGRVQAFESSRQYGSYYNPIVDVFIDETRARLANSKRDCKRELFQLITRGGVVTQMRPGLPSLGDVLYYPLKPGVGFLFLRICYNYGEYLKGMAVLSAFRHICRSAYGCQLIEYAHCNCIDIIIRYIVRLSSVESILKVLPDEYAEVKQSLRIASALERRLKDVPSGKRIYSFSFTGHFEYNYGFRDNKKLSITKRHMYQSPLIVSKSRHYITTESVGYKE